MAFITVDSVPFQGQVTSTALNTIHAQITAGLSDGTKDVKIGKLDVDNININGNTIISTDTDGDIDIAADGDGRVKLSRTFGNYTTSGFVLATNYQASVDLFVLITMTMIDGNAASITAFSDATTTPSQAVGAASAHYVSSSGISQVRSCYIMFPVKKGEYWRINKTVFLGAGASSESILTVDFGA